LKPKAYVKRELLGIILFPFIFVIVIIILFPILKLLELEFDVKIYLYWALFGLIAGVITLLITSFFVFKNKIITKVRVTR